jgi:hypothetical protein
MTRAVVVLAHDINEMMPKLSRSINGCAYDPVSQSIGFRVEDYSVVIDNHQMLIIGAENETQARNVLEWLIGKINSDETDAKKEDNYIYHNKMSISDIQVKGRD